MTGTCKDCKWWEKFDDDGFYSGADHYGDHACMRAECKDGGAVMAQRLHDFAVARDGENWHAVLLTGPSFGCIHFTPRNPPAGDGAFAYDHPVAGEKWSEK